MDFIKFLSSRGGGKAIIQTKQINKKTAENCFRVIRREFPYKKELMNQNIQPRKLCDKSQRRKIIEESV